MQHRTRTQERFNQQAFSPFVAKYSPASSVNHFDKTFILNLFSLIDCKDCLVHRWAIPHHSRGRQQEDRARGTAGPSTHPTLERRQSVPVIPAQAGRPPCGHASSVCEEGKAVQSSSLGPDRWKWLEAHPDHIMGQRSGKCKYNKIWVRDIELYDVHFNSLFLSIFLTVEKKKCFFLISKKMDLKICYIDVCFE